MEEVKFILPRLWAMSKPVMYKLEADMENLNSAGMYRFTSNLSYWGIPSKCVTSARLKLYDKSHKLIKAVICNYLDFKDLSLGDCAKLSFEMEVPRNVSYVKVEPMLFEESGNSWFGGLCNVFAFVTFFLWFILTVITIFI